jgi:sarcosine oxidase subunit alpha
MTGFRLPAGGRIDRAAPLGFTFDGALLHGYHGDTLASALLANGVSTVGRSFKYHRRRGLFAAGLEEPNAIVAVGSRNRITPNLKATQVELVDGLAARSVNCWPSAAFDLGAVIGAFARFLPAGFYYKTFMAPDWHMFEPAIRRAAGLGRAPTLPDPDRYETVTAHCEVLVVGAGAAGLAAAREAAAGGARVILVEHEAELGGRLLVDPATIDDIDGLAWAARMQAELAARPRLRILTRTTVFGHYDHNLLGAYERCAPFGAAPTGDAPAGRLWHIRAARVVHATGAFERPFAFAGNDLPGVMLAGAVRSYLARWGVAAGRRAVIATNNDDAYRTAMALLDAGVAVAALCDARARGPSAAADALRARGVPVRLGTVPLRALGSRALEAVDLRRDNGGIERIAADLLAISGGFNPVVHLHCQSGGTLRYDPSSAAFLPENAAQPARAAGASAGRLALADALADGARAGAWAVGHDGPRLPVPGAAPAPAPMPLQPLWEVPGGGRKAWVDLLSDVTTDDVRLAAREGYRSVEHLKRYTTLGMAADQGKTANVVGLALLAAATGRDIAAVGTTRFRPPFDPIPFGAMAGRNRGDLYRPRLYTPLHARHRALGASMEDFGGWQRPAAYPRRGEDLEAAARREAAQLRHAVGLFDASPLGKIEVEGPDAGRFLDRIYVGTMSTLPVGRVRYGLMLTEHGVITDDGVCARLGPERFLVGTSSGAATRIAAMLDEWLQGEWPDLRVFATPVTQQWGVVTLTGPRARAVLTAAGSDLDLSPGAFPHMRVREGHVAGLAARILRVSFTGEASYEINVAARDTPMLWDRLMAAGSDFDIAPFGVEALMILRIEKGYIHVGSDTDGTTLPGDIGMDGGVARKASDFVGRRSLSRPDALRADRHQLIGLLTEDPSATLAAGAHLVDPDDRRRSQGFVTSACWSPALGRCIGLGMLRGGRARIGAKVLLVDEGRHVAARIVAPCFLDPLGERLDA